MGVAGTLLTLQVAYGVIVSVLDVGARRRVAPCCDQLLILSQNTRTIRAAPSRGTLLMASATPLTRQYTRGRLIRGSWILDIFLTAKREGRFICGSTCTRVHTVVLFMNGGYGNTHFAVLLSFFLPSRLYCKLLISCDEILGLVGLRVRNGLSDLEADFGVGLWRETRVAWILKVHKMMKCFIVHMWLLVC